MFDVSWSELLVIGVVALIAIGPKELPGVLREFGKWSGKVRRMAADFRSQFDEAMREAEMADLHKHAQDINKSVGELTSFNPLESVKETIEKAAGELPSADIAPPVIETPPALETSSSPEASGVAPAANDAAPVVNDVAANDAAASPVPPKHAEGGA